jgi:hypothetical protein
MLTNTHTLLMKLTPQKDHEGNIREEEVLVVVVAVMIMMVAVEMTSGI